MDEPCRYIEDFLHREVPLSRQLGMHAEAYDGQALELHADLEPNINVYGAAFGGSLYSMCALAGWGLLTLKLRESSQASDQASDRASDRAPRIMIARGQIDYSIPVTDTIRARAQLPGDADFEGFLTHYRDRAKARIDIRVTILGEGRKPAACFIGNYVTA